MQNPHYICHIQFAEKNPPKRGIEAERERAVAIHDLLEENYFLLKGDFTGPYSLYLRPEGERLIFDIRTEAGLSLSEQSLNLKSLYPLVKQYLFACKNYYETLRDLPLCRIEALDMGRKALHDEGAEKLKQMLEERIILDMPTARRLFTLICVLMIRA